MKDKKLFFYIIGVGGTGSLLARDLPQLLIGTKHRMMLIDGDVVERKNIVRQSFQTQDIGWNKAIALAKKINTFYEINCLAHDKYIDADSLVKLINDGPGDMTPVILGCVDNDNTREQMERAASQIRSAIYIDSANSAYSGNVYVSAVNGDKRYGKFRSEVYPLEKDKNPLDISCQEQTAAGNLQYLVTNAKMAVCMLEHCFNLISDEPLMVGVTSIDRFKEIHY